MRRFLVALCALGLLSGCGGGVDSSLLATAVSNTEAAGGAEIAFGMKMHLPGAAEPDDQDRVRRMELEQRMEQAGVEVRMEVVAEYVRFGVPVEVDVPDDDQVFDATDLVTGAIE